MFNSAAVFDTSEGTSKRFSVPVVQELASQHLHSLPERYIRQKELEKLGTACQQWGFFQAVNHGIPVSMMERMKKIVREFVQLPLEEKLKYEMQEAEGYGQLFVASDNQVLDWSDIVFLTTLPTENRKMNFWPTTPADFRETVDRYALEIQKLCKTIFCLLSEKIGLKRDTFINMCGEMEQAIRMNYYPACPRPDLVLGISPHADGSALTALLQDDETVGLQIRKDGQWFSIQPIPGALVINVGDVLEVLSNGIYKSIEHRAVTNIDRDRVSIAMFYTPRKEAELGPAPELIDELNPCQYRTFIHEDYMRHFFRSKLEGKACLEFVRIK
ncbi:hypothetical protein SUGI_0544730 [Cryptomeria japonica]|nr:hypothetical protein SUGI_0544730 [Cryptomeria japonica]